MESLQLFLPKKIKKDIGHQVIPRTIGQLVLNPESEMFVCFSGL